MNTFPVRNASNKGIWKSFLQNSQKYCTILAFLF